MPTTDTYIAKPGHYRIGVHAHIPEGNVELFRLFINGREQFKSRLVGTGEMSFYSLALRLYLNRGDHLELLAPVQPLLETIVIDPAARLVLVLAGSAEEAEAYSRRHGYSNESAVQALYVMYSFDLAAAEQFSDTFLVLVGGWRERLIKPENFTLRRGVDVLMGKMVVDPPRAATEWRQYITRWLVDPCQASVIQVNVKTRQVWLVGRSAMVKFNHESMSLITGGHLHDLARLENSLMLIGRYRLRYVAQDSRHQFWEVMR